MEGDSSSVPAYKVGVPSVDTRHGRGNVLGLTDVYRCLFSSPLRDLLLEHFSRFILWKRFVGAVSDLFTPRNLPKNNIINLAAMYGVCGTAWHGSSAKLVRDADINSKCTKSLLEEGSVVEQKTKKRQDENNDHYKILYLR